MRSPIPENETTDALRDHQSIYFACHGMLKIVKPRRGTAARNNGARWLPESC